MKKNISLAVKGYKIFFSSTTLTLNSKPIAGLKINRKPVVGLTTKNCQLFSGRGNDYEISGSYDSKQDKMILSGYNGDAIIDPSTKEMIIGSSKFTQIDNKEHIPN